MLQSSVDGKRRVWERRVLGEQLMIIKFKTSDKSLLSKECCRNVSDKIVWKTLQQTALPIILAKTLRGGEVMYYLLSFHYYKYKVFLNTIKLTHSYGDYETTSS